MLIILDSHISDRKNLYVLKNVNGFAYIDSERFRNCHKTIKVVKTEKIKNHVARDLCDCLDIHSGSLSSEIRINSILRGGSISHTKKISRSP